MYVYVRVLVRMLLSSGPFAHIPVKPVCMCVCVCEVKQCTASDLRASSVLLMLPSAKPVAC